MIPAARCPGRSAGSGVIAVPASASACAWPALRPGSACISICKSAATAVSSTIRLLIGAGLALLLLEGPAFADDANEKLLIRLRAAVQQYDQIANQPPTLPAAEMAELRGKFRELLIEAASLAPDSQPFREAGEVFVFSGGNTAALQPFGKGLAPGSAEAKLFEGVMAYGEGRMAEAEAKLAAIDAANLNPMRAGHLNLALGLLLAPSDPARAFGYFQDAASLLPGTIVEEAALRQSASLAAKIGDPDKFTAATVNYLRRFRHSAYIDGAEKNLTPDFVQFPEGQALRILRTVMSAIPEGWDRCLDCVLADIAGQALSFGKLELAYVAATAGLPYAPAGSERQQRLFLYAGAAAIVTNRFEEGLQSLREVKPELLGQDDGQLLQVSLALGLKLQEMPVVLNSNNQKGSEVALAGNRVFPDGRRLDAAKRALSDASALLAGGN